MDNSAPSGTTPRVANRHRAIRSFRATAAIARLREPARPAGDLPAVPEVPPENLVAQQDGIVQANAPQIAQCVDLARQLPVGIFRARGRFPALYPLRGRIRCRLPIRIDVRFPTMAPDFLCSVFFFRSRTSIHS